MGDKNRVINNSADLSFACLNCSSLLQQTEVREIAELLSMHTCQPLRCISKWVLETVKPSMSVILNRPASAALT